MPRAQTDPDALRARALDIARSLLIEDGPRGVKAREVASRLGVSVGTVYNLFGDLEGLSRSLNVQVYDELYAAVTGGLAECDSPDVRERMLSLARAYLRYVADHAELWEGVLASNRRARHAPPAWYREKEVALLGVIKDVIGALPGAREAQSRDLAARALWSAVHGITTISVGRGGLIVPESEVQTQLDLVVGAVADRLSA